jgi:hypothetical protein
MRNQSCTLCADRKSNGKYPPTSDICHYIPRPTSLLAASTTPSKHLLWCTALFPLNLPEFSLYNMSYKLLPVTISFIVHYLVVIARTD